MEQSGGAGAATNIYGFDGSGQTWVHPVPNNGSCCTAEVALPVPKAVVYYDGAELRAVNSTGEIWHMPISGYLGTMVLGWDGLLYVSEFASPAYPHVDTLVLDQMHGALVRKFDFAADIRPGLTYESGFVRVPNPCCEPVTAVEWFDYSGRLLNRVTIPDLPPNLVQASVTRDGAVYLTFSGFWSAAVCETRPVQLARVTQAGMAWIKSAAYAGPCNFETATTALPDGGVAVTQDWLNASASSGISVLNADGSIRFSSSSPVETSVMNYGFFPRSLGSDSSGHLVRTFQMERGACPSDPQKGCRTMRFEVYSATTGAFLDSGEHYDAGMYWNMTGSTFGPGQVALGGYSGDYQGMVAGQNRVVGFASPLVSERWPDSERDAVHSSAGVLGDSYSSGEGAAWGGWMPGTDSKGVNMCHRSAGAFGVLGARAHGFEDVRVAACSGAKLQDLFGANGEGNQGEPAQLDALDASTQLVTLTIGGNDVGFANIASYCVTAQSCQGSPLIAPGGIDLVAAKIDSLFPRLVSTYQAVKARAPNATVEVFAYPQIFSGVECGSTFGFEADEQAWFQARFHQLDQVIGQAAAQAGVTFIDSENVLADHGGLLCGGGELANGFPKLPPQVFHPNVFGHAWWSTLVMGPGTVVAGTPPVVPGAVLSPLDVSGGVSPYTNPLLGVFRTGVSIPIAVQHVKPGEVVHFFLHSTPVDLGTATADSNGVVSTSVTAPAGTAAGLHTIDVQGTAADGNPGMGAAALIVDSTAGVISTMAGDGTAAFGGDNGPGTTAQVSSPGAVAADGSGNVVIADTANHRIRRVDAAGVITTIAGTGAPGFAGDNGPAAAAQLSAPAGVAVDGVGDVYVADAGNNRVRKIDSSGTITTVAGTGVAGFGGDNGPGTAALLSGPVGMTVSSSGDVFIADTGNNRVRKLDRVGTITTIAGTGVAGFYGVNTPAISANLNGPRGVAVNVAGEVFVADTNNNRIRKIDSSGTITTVAGNGTATVLNQPTGVASYDSANLLVVADTGNNRVRRVDLTTGVVTTIAGTGTAGYGGDGGPASTAVLNHPEGVTVDSLGVVTIADTANHRVRSMRPTSPPGKPSGVTAISGNAQATVSWSAADDGGSPVTGYTVTSSPGGKTCAWTTGPLSCTVNGLSNGVAYTFTVKAINVIGTSAVSAPSVAVTPATIPSTPTNVTGARGNGQATVSWTAASGNGSPVTGYTVTSNPDGKTCTWTTGFLRCTMTGLTNGTAYTFTVTATNTIGTGPASAPSNSVIPATTPGAPTNTAASPGNTQATVSWAAPASNGGLPITSYTVTSTPGGKTCTWTAGPLTCTVTGLSNGTAYTFTVKATNTVGAGPASTPSGPVTPATVPGPPTSPHATSGNAQATITWTAPASNGGASISGYTVTSNPDGKTCTWISGPLTCTVTGLSNGTAYTFTVTATNNAGTSTSSGLSNNVTPTAPVTTPSAPTSPIAVASRQSAVVSWSAPVSNGGAPITGYTVTSTPGAQTCGWSSGPLSCTVNGLTAGVIYTFTVTATNSAGTGPPSVPSNTVTPWDGAGFHPVTPTRILDSRGPTGGWNTKLAAGAPKALSVTGGILPASASAVVMNVTVTNASAGSFLSVWPAGQAQPNSSNLNFAAGQTIPNLVTAKIGTGGQVSFANAVGTVDVIADVVGYYDDGTGPGDLYNGITPTRLLDSRTPTGGWNTKLIAGAPKDLVVAQPGNPVGVPATATAVIANITATGGTAGSFLSVWPSGQAQPNVSNLNFAAGQTIPNLVIVKIGAGGKISFANAIGAVDVIVDVVGYFDPTTGSRFHPINPTRALDDRMGTGLTGPWGPNQSRLLPIAGVAGTNVPAGATGLVTNITATNATTGSFVTAYPDGVARPNSSNLNFGAGQTIPNLVTVKLPPNGTIDLYNALGNVDLIADTVGYYNPT